MQVYKTGTYKNTTEISIESCKQDSFDSSF